MHLIPLDDRRGTNPKNPLPRQVRMLCPGPDCAQEGIFGLSWKRVQNGRMSWAVSRCWDCNEEVTCVAMPREGGRMRDASEVDVFAYPAPQVVRSPLEGLSEIDEFDEPLERVYRSAIQAYNYRDWGGAAVHTGKVLEGLAKSLIPEDGHDQNLYNLLSALPRHVDLKKPLVDLAHAIRKGRNLAAHFNQEKETDRETARLCLDLLDELLEYLLVTPQHITALKSRVD